MYNLLGGLDPLTGLIFLKYLEIWLTFFCDLAGIGGGIFSMLAGIGLPAVLLLWLDSRIILGVSLSKIFFLREIVFLSAIRESYLDWYTKEIRFQIASLIPLKSSKSTCLLTIYLAMKLSESLMFLEFEAICSIELWSKIGWKLPSQRSGSIGVFRSYCN